jgi:hypothetical protein
VRLRIGPGFWVGVQPQKSATQVRRGRVGRARPTGLQVVSRGQDRAAQGQTPSHTCRAAQAGTPAPPFNRWSSPSIPLSTTRISLNDAANRLAFPAPLNPLDRPTQSQPNPVLNPKPITPPPKTLERSWILTLPM